MVNNYKSTYKMGKGLTNILIYFSLVVILTSCSSSSDDDFYEQSKDCAIHVLVFGDSFSRDAFSYVPFIMEEMCPGLTIDMEILCLNGKSLHYHIDYLNKNKSDFVLDLFTSYSGRWNTMSGVSGEKVISSKVWDLVVMQESSIAIRDYAQTQSRIDSLSNYIKEKQPNVKLSFMLPPAKPDSSPALGNYTSDEVWEINKKNSYKLLVQNRVNYVIPCGTGIQNARYTSLDDIGDFGHLSYDGNHLQEGLPCLIEAYTATQLLFDMLSIDASIMNSNLRITQQWVYNKNIPGQHGSVITGTTYDYELCKRCALLAVENPYQISIIP